MGEGMWLRELVEVEGGEGGEDAGVEGGGGGEAQGLPLLVEGHADLCLSVLIR